MEQYFNVNAKYEQQSQLALPYRPSFILTFVQYKQNDELIIIFHYLQKYELKMPLSAKPKCHRCEKTESLLWKNVTDGHLCLECYELNKNNIKVEPEEQDIEKTQEESQQNGTDSKSASDTNGVKAPTRKSTRSTRYKPKNNPTPYIKPLAPKGKGRRNIFKKTPMKAPSAVSTVVTSKSIFYKGSYIQVGDIVSVIDTDGDTYYAQIRGLLTDQYCEKSAVLTWLLPTKASPAPDKGFDPATYIIGPEEDLPRRLDCFEFIMHAPSEYYKTKNTPYPLTESEVISDAGFIWTNLEAVDRISKENT